MSKLNVQFSENQTKALDRMAHELEVSKVEVIRRALALLSAVRREIADGCELGVIRDGKVLKMILVLS